MVRWKDNWMHGWLNVCWSFVGSGSAGPLAWRRARKPIGRGLWRGVFSRKPKLLLTNSQHPHSHSHASNYPSNQSSGRTLTHTFVHPHIHSPTHSFTWMAGWMDVSEG